MKWIFFLMVVFSLNGCKKEKYSESYDRILYEIFSEVEYYYYYYLEYPDNVDQLIESFWNRISGLNDFRFKTYEELLLAEEKEYFSPLSDAYEMLVRDSSKIKMYLTENEFILEHKCNKFPIERQDICSLMVDDVDRKLHYKCRQFYDLNGKIIWKNREDYQDEFYELIKTVYNKYPSGVTQEENGEFIWFLFRYSPEKGLRSQCTNEVDLSQYPSLEELCKEMDVFMEERDDIKEIQFIAAIAY